MTKRPKRKRKRGKPGPKEEVLRITADPKAALDRLLKKPRPN